MKYYLAACLMVKNEELYIEEWLKYHLSSGFDHIFIYNNESTDKTVEIAEKFGNKVTIHDVFGTAIQYKTYSTCMIDHGRETRWLAYIDTDEFVAPKTKSLIETLKDYEAFSGLCVHWVLFGNNGHDKYENKPVVERFTKREIKVNPHVKSFVDPSRVIKLHTSHKWFHVTPAVDEHFKFIEDSNSTPTPATSDIIQLNHYVTKSKQECFDRRSKLRPDVPHARDVNQFYIEHNKNEVEDLTAYKLWKNIK